MKYLLAAALLLITSQAYGQNAPRWECKANCSLDCPGQPQRYWDEMGYGPTKAYAKSDASGKCYNPHLPNECNQTYTAPDAWCTDNGPRHHEYTIIFRNRCAQHGAIAFAIRYKDLNGNWQTRGFKKVAYGKTAKMALTRNRIYYAHGHAQNGVTWGNGRNYTIGNKSYSFSKYEIPSNTIYGPVYRNFTCN